MSVETIGTLRRWSMLAIALTATLCANVFINGAAFLIPTLHTERHLDLAKAGLLSSMPSFGMVVTLIAWGYVVDRIGERIVLALGSALTAAAAFAAASVHALGRRRRVSVARWHGGSKQQFGQRPVGGGLVPTGAAWSGDGHPADRPAVGSRVGRLGDSRLAERQGVSVALLFPAVVCAMFAVCTVPVDCASAGARRRRSADQRAGPRCSAVSSAALDIIDKYFTCEFTTLSRDGSPHVAHGSEAAHRRTTAAHNEHRAAAEGVQHRNSKVSLLFSEPKGSGIAEPGAVLIQGDATAEDRIVTDGVIAPRVRRHWRKPLPCVSRPAPRGVRRWVVECGGPCRDRDGSHEDVCCSGRLGISPVALKELILGGRRRVG